MDDESGESMEPMEKVPLEIRRDTCGCGLRPDPRWGSLRTPPDPLAAIGAYILVRERREEKGSDGGLCIRGLREGNGTYF